MDEETIEIARKIKAVVFDNDGVLTDNTENIGFPDGTVLKRRSHYDGQGISFLRAIGVRVAILTGDSGMGAEAITQLVRKWNSLPSVKMENGWNMVHLTTGIMGQAKANELQTWLSVLAIEPHECAVMGDDFVDLPMMTMAGFRAAPITAEKQIREIAHFISERPAGQGAVRDLVNFILKVKGIDPATLATS